MAQRVKIKKTTDEILKANLTKTLRLMKTKVADREQLWLEIFQDAISALVNLEGSTPTMIVVEYARVIADSALDEYETRWGKG